MLHVYHDIGRVFPRRLQRLLSYRPPRLRQQLDRPRVRGSSRDEERVGQSRNLPKMRTVVTKNNSEGNLF